MEQLKLKLIEKKKDKLEEIKEIKSAWRAFHYAEKNDPNPSTFEYGRFYLPRSGEEAKKNLKRLFPEDKNVNKMNARQAKKVYVKITKYITGA